MMRRKQFIEEAELAKSYANAGGLPMKENVRKDSIIIANIAEPYLIENKISPLNVKLTSDLSNQPGGLSYLTNNTNELNINLIHDLYKNDYNIVLPCDTKIIFGGGTSMMVAALYYALNKKLGIPIRASTNTNIFYTLHENIASLLKNIEWVDNSSISDLAVIVSPNNPIGIITDPKEVKQKYMLYDVVYDKPIFTGSEKSINENLYNEFSINSNIFITSSFSKLGIPGARFGYLLTRDTQIAEYCEEFVDTLSIRYSSTGATIARLGYYKYFMNKLWQLNIYTTLFTRRCNFLTYASKHKIIVFTKCDQKNLVPFLHTDKSVDWWKKTFLVETRKGGDFNDTDEHSRFNLMISEPDWYEFMRRFRTKSLL